MYSRSEKISKLLWIGELPRIYLCWSPLFFISHYLLCYIRHALSKVTDILHN